jgi:2,4-dienoyl-CoA reductase (NADPH2)
LVAGCLTLFLGMRTATAAMFTGISGDGDPISATADFSLVGDTLTVKLTNTTPFTHSADELFTGIDFRLSGLSPTLPSLAGIDHSSVVGYVDLLSGRVQPGANVAIIGAGGIGFDVALFLLERNARATLEPEAFAKHWGIVRDRAAAGGLDPKGPPPAHPAHKITLLKRSAGPFGATLGRTTGWVHRSELARNGVTMLKGVEYRRIDDAGLHIALDGKEQVVAADTIVICAGQEPLRPFTAPHVIGGAKLAAELDAKRAMLEGAELAAAL